MSIRKHRDNFHAPRGFCSERRHNLVIPLTGFSRNVFVLARKELALNLPKGGVAWRRTSIPPRGASRSVIEIAEVSAATAEGSGQVGRRSHRPRAEKDPFRTETSSGG